MNLEKALAHLSKDPILQPLIERLPPPAYQRSEDVYFYLLRSITFQQLSGKAASTIFDRFLDLFTDKYPHSEQVLAFSVEDLRAVGLSRQKASYIQNVAHFFQEEGIEQKNWLTMTDEEIIKFLTQIKGVGKWTVQMILMFVLNRPDVLPLDDLAIRQGITELYGIQETGRALKPRLTKVAEAWRPYRTAACWYIWRRKDD